MSTNEWWRGGVVYQIYPRSFVDSNGDGVGDLPGITGRLEHIASLGVEAIWISPIFKSPMKDFGYDVSDYRDIDPVFGTLDDFRVLLDRAHGLGLKVMIDQVWSHTSDQHDWFKESRSSDDNSKADWYVWANPKPDGTAPNNWISYFGGPAWAWDPRRQQYYLHQFLKEQPNLNLWNPAVREELKSTAAFWLDMGVDGFRLDAIHTFLSDRRLRDNPPTKATGIKGTPDGSNPMAWQKRLYNANLPENLEWAEEIRDFVNQWPDRCLLAEVDGDDPQLTLSMYVRTGRRFHLAYSFSLIGSAMEKAHVVKFIDKTEKMLEDGWCCWAISNHDWKRVASRIVGTAPLADKALYATIMGLCLRGSYCMYQGEELGLPQADLAYEDLVDPFDKTLYPEHVGRDGCRTPMPWMAGAMHAGFSTAPKTWLPVSTLHVPLAVDVQENDPQSVLHVVRAFLHWRKQNDVMRLGAIEFIETPDPVLAFRRSMNGRGVVCVFNCSDHENVISLDSVGINGMLLPEISRHAAVSVNALRLEAFGYAFFGE